MLIIETNLSYDDDGELKDHQSRVISSKSWEEYIDNIKNYKSRNYNGTLFGNNIPKYCTIENLKYDNICLSCDVYPINSEINIIKKLAYRVNDMFELYKK